MTAVDGMPQCGFASGGHHAAIGDRAGSAGYARVSTQDQNIDLQHDALRQAGCKKIYEDKASGSRAERPGLNKAMEILREGDKLVVWKLDRLGRSVKQLVDMVEDLHKQGVQFKSLTDSIDTRPNSRVRKIWGHCFSNSTSIGRIVRGFTRRKLWLSQSFASCNIILI